MTKISCKPEFENCKIERTVLGDKSQYNEHYEDKSQHIYNDNSRHIYSGNHSTYKGQKETDNIFMSILINPTAPFDFSKILQRMENAWKNETYIIDKNMVSLQRTIIVNGKVLPVKITSIGTVEKPKLAVKVPSSLDEANRDCIIEAVKNLFSVDADLNSIYNLFSSIS